MTLPMRVENHSSYPREGDASGAPKQPPASALTKDQRDAARRAIREQEEAGCHVVTDGQLRLADGVSPLAGNFDGITLEGPVRFLGTNLLLKRPHARTRIHWKGPLTAPDFLFASARTKKAVKAVLTGPVTLARHTAIETDAYPDASALAADYAEGLLAEAKALFAAGAAAIQVEEPSILAHPEDMPVLKHYLGQLSEIKPPGAVVGLATYYGDAAMLYLKLLELPVGALVWDLASSDTLEERISRGFSKVLGLGIVDARSAEIEKPEDLARRVEKIAAKARGEVRLLPSSGLGHLTRDQARKKLQALARAWTFLEGTR